MIPPVRGGRQTFHPPTLTPTYYLLSRCVDYFCWEHISSYLKCLDISPQVNKYLFLLVVFQRFVNVFQLSGGWRADQSAVESGHSEAGHQSRSEHLLLQVLRNLPLWRTQRVEEHLEVSGGENRGLLNSDWINVDAQKHMGCPHTHSLGRGRAEMVEFINGVVI